MGLANYAEHFLKTCGMTREALLVPGRKFEATLKAKVPHLYEEMQGIAAGSGQEVIDIVLLNSRFEIVLTAGDAHAQLKMMDGCSTYGQIYNAQVWAAQNWDWQSNQKDQLVHLVISPAGKPKCHILTEGGLVGKIGINEAGVVINVNAIKATNLDTSKLPIHVLLRVPLECANREDAVQRMGELGAASVGHVSVVPLPTRIGRAESFQVMISDPSGISSLETNPDGPWAANHLDSHGRVFHTNHLIVPDRSASMREVFFLKDTGPRLARLKQLVDETLAAILLKGAGVNGTTNGVNGANGVNRVQDKALPSHESIFQLLKDEQGAPFGICRAGTTEMPSETIFSIVRNCSERRSRVAIGRPCDVKEWVELAF